MMGQSFYKVLLSGPDCWVVRFYAKNQLVPWTPEKLAATLSRLVEPGFVLERFGEPCPSDRALRKRPRLQDAQVLPYFLQSG